MIADQRIDVVQHLLPLSRRAILQRLPLVNTVNVPHVQIGRISTGGAYQGWQPVRDMKHARKETPVEFVCLGVGLSVWSWYERRTPFVFCLASDRE